jgi:pyrrolidone-carboxylate peptidase
MVRVRSAPLSAATATPGATEPTTSPVGGASVARASAASSPSPSADAANTAWSTFAQKAASATLALAQGASLASPVLLENDAQHRFLQLTPHVGAVLSEDAGSFYCSHVFFAATQQARQPGSSILKNGEGAPLTSFLHVPADAESFSTMKPRPNAERFAQLRTMVGLAIRGYALEAAPQLQGQPLRVLVTGFATSGAVQSNPTGAFVGSVGDLDASMAQAFRIAGPGEREQVSKEGARVRYTILEPTAALPTTIHVELRRLEVGNSAVSGGADSIQKRIQDFSPHAVLSMGVKDGMTNYTVEISADDSALRAKGSGYVRDEWQDQVRERVPNLSLYRALVRALEQPRSPDAAPS